MNKLLIFIVIIIAIAAVAGVAVYMRDDSKSPEAMVNSETGSMDEAGAPVSEEVEEGTVGGEVFPSDPSKVAVIKYTDNGYDSRSVRVKAGTRVTFVNASAVAMWPASAVHPTHQILPEFDARGGIQPGGEYSFTFERAGSWKFHDHLKPTNFGEIVVE